MSGPYEESVRPFGNKIFTCSICKYTTLTKLGMWDHIEKKHPDVDQNGRKST